MKTSSVLHCFSYFEARFGVKGSFSQLETRCRTSLCGKRVYADGTDELQLIRMQSRWKTDCCHPTASTCRANVVYRSFIPANFLSTRLFTNVAFHGCISSSSSTTWSHLWLLDWKCSFQVTEQRETDSHVQPHVLPFKRIAEDRSWDGSGSFWKWKLRPCRPAASHRGSR